MSTHRELSEYTESDKTDHELAKMKIADVLTNRAVGKNNAISSADLAEQTPVSASTVRDLIPEVRREKGIPVGSSNGYFVISDPAVAEEQIERQKRQAETSRRAAQEIAKAWYGSRLDQ